MGKYIVTFHPKHPKWDQNLQFAPLKWKEEHPRHFYKGVSPPPRAADSLLMQLFINIYKLSSFTLIEDRENWNTLFFKMDVFLFFLKPIQSVCENF